ncbi:DUF2125 domain-containing protein [Phenylobacterium sp.]|uniref:DUF2125 domain-containing protein n=1 Tax=Phenylobacterium sp. TaxID=1871053 RepID=UPI0035AF33D4
MSVPDPQPARKPNRFWLYAPFVLLLIGAVAWSGFWIWARNRMLSAMDGQADALRQAGYEVSWKSRKLYGYPFRLDVELTDARLRDPSGWGVSSPRFEAESYLYAPGHWVMATPEGFSLLRPSGGAVVVTGQLLHASLVGQDQSMPRFVFQGTKVAFAPAAGAAPFALASAELAALRVIPGPDDQGAAQLRVEGGKARAGTVLGDLAGDKAVAVDWDSILSKMSGFDGADWASAVRAWSRAGGRATVRQAGITAGDTALNVRAGRLAAGADGRLTGDLSLELRGAGAAVAALARRGLISQETAESAGAVVAARQGAGDSAQVDLVFQAGRTTLGPVSLGPAPKLY